MKFYVTNEGTQKLKKSFLNLKMFSIINVQEIIQKFGFDENDLNDYRSFIVSNKIIDLIETQSKSKRIRGIIYSNSNISEQTIMNLYDMIDHIESISEVVLLDEYNLPKLNHLYGYFDEIIYFPSIKKIRLIEAVTFDKIKADNADKK